ncbi:hypothetical protein VTL71DRAFT_10234 [Oculimacula yallundae]|uniref:Uncharacterized protein n=1 Tax=Oculimacula yallundae TaxID=86028 RepID=A0ABR4BPM0_9HELO
MGLVDTIRYNELPSLEEASLRRQTENIDELIRGPIRDVFLRHGVQDMLTLYLQHRHHTVLENEAVIKVQGTAHLMNQDEMNDIQGIGNKVVPTTWMGPNLLPMEFSVMQNSDETPTVSPNLVADLSEVLAANGCEGLFGIDTLAATNWTELTVGNASVVVPSNGNDREEDYYPVAFAFDKNTPGFRVHGKCGKDHKHSSKPEDRA